MAAAAAAEVSNKRVILKRHVTGFPTEDDMELVPATARLAVPPGSAAVVVKNLYLSCDPYMRSRMSRHDEPSYVPDFVQGEVLTTLGVSKVVESGHQDYKPGDLVWGMTGCEEYTLITNLQTHFKINHPELPLSYYTGVLGMPGLTAYVGFFDVAKPKKGDYVFVINSGWSFMYVTRPNGNNLPFDKQKRRASTSRFSCQSMCSALYCIYRQSPGSTSRTKAGSHTGVDTLHGPSPSGVHGTDGMAARLLR